MSYRIDAYKPSIGRVVTVSRGYANRDHAQRDIKLYERMGFERVTVEREPVYASRPAPNIFDVARQAIDELDAKR